MVLNVISHPLLLEAKLSVCSVDLLSSKTSQNRQEHHTDLYHGDELVIRRGQTFQVELELNRPFSADTDKLHLELKTGMKLMTVSANNELRNVTIHVIIGFYRGFSIIITNTQEKGS